MYWVSGGGDSEVVLQEWELTYVRDVTLLIQSAGVSLPTRRIGLSRLATAFSISSRHNLLIIESVISQVLVIPRYCHNFTYNLLDIKLNKTHGNRIICKTRTPFVKYSSIKKCLKYRFFLTNYSNTCLQYCTNRTLNITVRVFFTVEVGTNSKV